MADQSVIHPDHELSESELDLLRTKREESFEANQARLTILEHELARLDRQSLELDTECRARWLDARSELNRLRSLAGQKLRQLKSKPVDGWLDLMAEVDNARQDLSAALARARSQFHRPG